MIFRDSRMEGKKAIDVDGEFLYGTDMTLRAHFSDYDEESERLVWLRRGSPDAVRFFHDDIDNRLGPDVAIVTVPSHSPSRGQNVGIGSLAEALAKGRRVNLGVHLRRHKKVPSLTEQPIREIELHLESITAAPRVFAGREILLLDDLAFTGNSMKACGELLMRAGASRVGFLVLQRILQPGRRAAIAETRRRLPGPGEPEAPEQKTYPPRPSRVSCSNLEPAAPRPGVPRKEPDDQAVATCIRRARDTLIVLGAAADPPADPRGRMFR